MKFKSFRTSQTLTMMILLILVPRAAVAVEKIDDGATYTVSGYQTAAQDFDVDHQAGEGGGTLEITSTGTLAFSVSRTISNTYTHGQVRLDGTLLHNSATPSFVLAPIQAGAGSVLRASQSGIHLGGGGSSYEGNFDANGGDIFFSSGSHNLNGATITGSHSVYALGGPISITGNVNPLTGAATGGLVVLDGTITSLAGGLGGASMGNMLSVARAGLGDGMIWGARIRITGTGENFASSTLNLPSASLINEGTFTQRHLGRLNVDPEEDWGGGSVINYGMWNLEGDSRVRSSMGGGKFINHGTVSQIDPLGFSTFSAEFENKSGATIQTVEGSAVVFSNGGTYASDTNFHADGTIEFANGNHVVTSGNLTGTGYLRTLNSAANLSLIGSIGPITGPATGGFHLGGGGMVTRSADDLGAILGGASFGRISAERGKLSSGSIDDVTLRFTGASEKLGNSGVTIRTGMLVNEGTMVQRGGGFFQLDPDSTENISGTIVNQGTWTMEGYADIRSQHGEGLFQNENLLVKTGDGDVSFCFAKFRNEDDATIQVDEGATLVLSRGGSYGTGTTFHADGDLMFGGGSHIISGANVTGTGYLETLGSNSNLGLFGSIGPTSGPATGGFHFGGGTITNLGALGGPNNGVISAERGKIGSGTIDGARLRFTGASEKLGFSEVAIRTGRLVNEGTMTQAEEGNFQLDPEVGGAHGRIENRGIWSITGPCKTNGDYGQGVFENHGLLQVEEDAGLSFIGANFKHAPTGTLRVLGGAAISLSGSSIHPAGSVLDVAGGSSILLAGAAHLLDGCTIIGDGDVRCSGMATHIISRVGAATGLATGGFSIIDGILRGAYDPGNGVLVAGEDAGHIAVDHGRLGGLGWIEGAHLRYTGNAEKLASAFSFIIADGSLTNDGAFTQEAGGNFELHAANPVSDGGTIRNNGTWESLGASVINSANGGGLFRNAGTLNHVAGNLTISAPFENTDGGTLTTGGGTVILNKNTSHLNGSVLNAANGNISLRTSTHSFHGGAISGAGYVELQSGMMQVLGDVGTTSGLAGGRLLLNGGTLNGTAQVSVSDANFQSGLITGGVTLRTTGISSKSASGTLSMNGGTIRNEGILSLPANPQINLDSASSAGAGVLRNDGEFYTLGGSLTNTHGSGVFQNNGLARNDEGNMTYQSAFENLGNGRLRNQGNNIYLSGGGQHFSGSVLDSASGPIYLNGGTHTFHGGGFEGAGMTYASAGTMLVQGDVGAPTGSAAGGFGIAGGTVTGSGTVSAERGYFSTGTLSGSVVLRFTGGFTKAESTVLNMNGGTLQSDGLYDTPGGTDFNLDSLSSAGAGTIINKGTWRLNDASNYTNSYGDGRFVNYGLLESMLGNSHFYCAFDSMAGSTLRANAGILRLRGGGVQYPGATLHTNGGDIYYSGGTHQLLGGTFDGPGFVYTTAGTVSVQGDVGATTGPATGGFGISAGTVTGTAMVSAERGSFYTGSVSGGVTMRFTGNSTKWASSVLNMNGGTILNEGTMTQQGGGNFNLDHASSAGAGTLVNTGTWEHTGATSIQNSYEDGLIENHNLWHVLTGNSTNHAYFTHHPDSVFRVSGGQMVFMGGSNLKQDATLDASGGAIYLNGGTHTLEGGDITGANWVYSGGGSTVVMGDVGSTNGPATGGFGIYSTGVVRGTAMLSVERGYLDSGSMSGDVTLRFTGASQKIAGSTLNINGGTIRNEGVMTHLAGGTINLDNLTTAGAGTIVNTGTWNHAGAATIINSYGDGKIDNLGMWHVLEGNSTNHAYFTHHPDSVFRVSGGQMIFMGGSNLKPDATLDANGGAIYLNGGTHTLEGGDITGENWVYSGGGSTVVTGDVGSTTGAATGGFGIYNIGVVRGTAMLSVERGYFSSGSMSGDVTLRLTGASQKISGTLNMNGGTIRNEGVMTHVAGGTINLDNASTAGAGTLVNTGTWNQTGASSISNSYDDGHVDNFGLWHVSAGNSSSSAAFTQREDSVLRVTAGQMILTGGGTMKSGATIDADGGYVYFSTGTHTLEGGTITGSTSIYTNAGSTVVTGEVGAATGPATGGYGLIGGTLSGTGIISAERGYIGSGNMAGAVTLRYTGDSNKIAGTISMSGGTIINEGTMTVAAGGDFNLDINTGAGSGAIVNNGAWIQTGSANFLNSYLQGTLENSGSFEVNAGTTQVYGHFTNSGITRVDSGTLILRRGSVHTGALISNGSVSFVGGGHSLTGPDAYLGGSGAFSGNVTLAEGAGIAPGNSTGALSLNGTVQFLAGTEAPSIRMELAAAADFDQIVVGNGANLTLGTEVADLLLDLQFQPMPGQSFRIISAGAGTGVIGGRFRNAPVSGGLVAAMYQGNPYHFRVDYDAGGKFVDLVYQSGYALWIAHNLLTGDDAAFDADPDGDGVPNGIEFITGRNPRPGFEDSSLPGERVPLLDETHLIFVHRRVAAARYLPTVVQYNTGLSNAWTPATQGVNGVTIEIDEDFHSDGSDKVETRIPRSLAAGGRLFVRLWSSE